MAIQRKTKQRVARKLKNSAVRDTQPARPQLGLPCYERAFRKLINELTYAFARADNPIIAKLGFRQEVPILHRQQVSGAKGTTTLESAPIGHEFAVSNEDLLRGHREAFLILMWEMGQKLAAGLMQQLVDNLNRVTGATGMVINGKNYPNRVERFLAMLETVELTFDDQGNFQPPTVMAGTKESASLMDDLNKAGPDAHKRYEAIIAKKREAWLATRSARCLPQLFQD